MLRSGRAQRACRRRGMTLVELLVAMSILLVGIWAVARGFPALFGSLEAERERAEMVRLTEGVLERFKTSPEQIPEAIAGHDPADGMVIPPDVYPDEDMEPVPGNPRDDLTWVLGEMFEVPGLQPGQSVCVYPLKLGPAIVQDPSAIDDYLQVFRLAALERVAVSQDEWVAAGRPLGDDEFFLDRDGYLYAPPEYASARVDYCWMDVTGAPHWVEDEVVANVNYSASAAPVRAADVTGPQFANCVPEMADARAMVRYAVAIGGVADVAADTAVLEQNFGATLLLPDVDAGETMHVNYQQRTEPDLFGQPRRVPVVVEEFSAPTQPPYRVDLKFGGIDDEVALFENDLLGNPLPNVVRVLVVDLLTGDAWTDAASWIEVDMIEGRLTLDWDNAGAPMAAAQARGRDLRVYYRTLRGHTVVVQKAPAYFLEEPIKQTYEDPDPSLDESDKVDYRYYTVSADPNDPAYTRLQFPESAAGQTVVVDYLVDTGQQPPFERVSGELHVIDGESLAIVLQRPDVAGIIAVRGASLKVRGWWHDQHGRVQMVGVETFLVPEPLL